MADFLLAAHIRVTGGEAAVAELRKVDQAMSQVGKSTSSQTGSGITAGLKDAEKQAGALHGALGRVGDAMIRMATYTGLAAIGAGIFKAVDGVLDFDQAMTESLAIQSGVTDKMRSNMEGLAKSIAVDLGQSPKDVAEGFYFLASAGLTVEQQMAALPQVSAFAKAGMMDLEEATEMAYDALSALGLKAADPQVQLANLTKLTDVLTVAAIRSQGTIEQFGEAISNKAGASMRSFGIPMEEGVGLLAVFADQGIKGKVAGERMNMIIRDMALKSLTNADAWKRMGIEVYDAGGNFQSLPGIFRQVDAALLPLTDAQRVQALKDLGFTLKDVGTIQSLLGKSDALAGFTSDLYAAGGAAQEVADKQMEALRAKLDQLKAATMVFAIDGFDKLQEAGAWLASTFAPAINAVFDALGKMGSAAAPAVEALGRLAGATVAGGLKGIAAALDAVFSTIAGNEGLANGLTIGLATLGTAAVLGPLRDLAVHLSGPLYRAFGDAKWAFDGFIQNFRAANFATSSGAIDALAGAFRGLGTALKGLVIPAGIVAGVMAITEIFQSMEEGKRSAQDFRAMVEKPYNMQTAGGVSQAYAAVRGEIEKMDREKGGLSFLEETDQNFLTLLDDLSLGMFDYSKNTHETAARKKELVKVMGEYDQAMLRESVGMGILGEAFGSTIIDTKRLAEEFERGKIAMDPVAIKRTADSLELMGRHAGIAKVPAEDLARILPQLAVRKGIDTTGPWEEWAPQLALAYVEMTKVRDMSVQLGGAAQGVGTNMTGMQSALETLRDAAANAEEKLSALKILIDGMDQGGREIFGAENAWARSIDEFREALALGTDSTGEFFSLWNEGGRRQRESLEGITKAAIDLAVAQGGGAEGMAAGVAHLQGYADGIRTMMAEAGVAPAKIEEMIAAMGLTPEKIKTIIEVALQGEKPADVAAELKAIDGTTAKAKVEAYTDVGQAEGELDRLAQAQRIANVSIGMPNFPEAITNMDTVTMGRTQNTVIDLSNQPEANQKLDETAGPRTQPTTVELPNNEDARRQLNETAAQRTARIVAEAYTAAAQAAIDAIRGKTVYVDIVTTYSTVNATGSSLASLAKGGIIESYATGGMRMKERHVAQIAPAGSWRLWAEPETGGEAYIPLAQSKRDQSMAIWEEVGRRFGVNPGSNTAFNVNAPISVQVDGAGHLSAEAVGAAVARQTAAAVDHAMGRLLVETRARLG